MSAQALRFDIPGDPQSQGSAKAFVVGGKARITHSNPRLMSWRRDAVLSARAAMGEGFPMLGAVEVVATFWLRRPRSHYGTGRNAGRLKDSAPVLPENGLDADKLGRGLLDALTAAGVWRDDSQVATLVARKRWAEDGAPGVSVTVLAADRTFAEIPAPPSPEEARRSIRWVGRNA